MTQVGLFVGIDVSKLRLDVALTTGEGWQVANTAAGWADLAARLGPLCPAAVGLEASGGYERGVLEALVEAGFCVRLVEPRRVRSFAAALGRQAKTDRLDAELIACFCQAVPGRAARLDRQSRALAELVDARRALSEERVRLATQAKQLRDPMLARMAARRLKRLAAEIVLVEARLAALVAADPDLAGRDRLMRSVPGVGPVLSWTLLAHMPELGQIGHKQIAALAGVAPFDRQSGAKRGKSAIKGGRAAVRNTAYMAALSGARHNPALAAFACRLNTAAKPAKVVLTALIRKLLTILNAILRDGTEWKTQTP